MAALGDGFMQGAQDMGDFIIGALGDLLGKTVNGVISVAAKAGNAMAGAAVAATTAVSAPFKPDFTPASSPQVASGNKVEAPSRGQEREISGEAALGNITPTPIAVAKMPTQSQGMAI